MVPQQQYVDPAVFQLPGEIKPGLTLPDGLAHNPKRNAATIGYVIATGNLTRGPGVLGGAVPLTGEEQVRLSATAKLHVWAVTDTAGFEAAWVDLDGMQLRAKGRTAGQLPVPYWLSYELLTGPDAATSRLIATAATAESTYHLDLSRGDHGWEIDGQAAPQLIDALDCDLAFSPLTNTMPIIRHGLHLGDAHRDFVMAFVEVPELRVSVSHQSYTYLASSDSGSTVRFSSGDFSADLLIDPDGFVIDYPTLAHRIQARPPSAAS